MLRRRLLQIVRYPGELWSSRRFLFTVDIGPIKHNWRSAWLRADRQGFEELLNSFWESPLSDEDDIDLFLCGTGHCPIDPCPHHPEVEINDELGL